MQLDAIEEGWGLHVSCRAFPENLQQGKIQSTQQLATDMPELHKKMHTNETITMCENTTFQRTGVLASMTEIS